MAHEIDMSNNRANMAYRGEKPWHGLGTEMQDGMSIDEWRVAAGLDWEVEEHPIFADVGESQIEIPGTKALIRSDNQFPLSTVSSNYKVVNVPEVVEFFRSIVEGVDAGFTMECMGALKHGKKVFALARRDDELDLGGDKTLPYLLMATSFDRSLPTLCKFTTIRVQCSNTLALANKEKSGVRITHNSHFNAETIKEELGLDQWTLFAANCKRLADRQVSDEECRKFVADCMAFSSPTKNSEYYMDLQEDNKNYKALYEDIKFAKGQDTSAASGTAYGLLQGLTHFTNHTIASTTQDSRTDSVLFGKGNRINQFGMNRALELV